MLKRGRIKLTEWSQNKKLSGAPGGKDLPSCEIDLVSAFPLTIICSCMLIRCYFLACLFQICVSSPSCKNKYKSNLLGKAIMKRIQSRYESWNTESQFLSKETQLLANRTDDLRVLSSPDDNFLVLLYRAVIHNGCPLPAVLSENVANNFLI